MDLPQFLSQFRYNKGRAGHLGAEQECFIANERDEILPDAYRVLAGLKEGIPLPGREGLFSITDGEFVHELSACQLESRVGPCLPAEFGRSLEARRREQ